MLIKRAQRVWTFSHLTFEEHLVAKNIVKSIETQKSTVFSGLVKHITEKRWREVFLLTGMMLREADDLLNFTKQEIDILLADNTESQQVLSVLDAKVASIKAPHKPSAIRAFYLAIYLAINFEDWTLERALKLAYSIDSSIKDSSAFDLALALSLYDLFSNTFLFGISIGSGDGWHSIAIHDLVNSINSVLGFSSRVKELNLFEQFKEELESLLSSYNDDIEVYDLWWNCDGDHWINEIRSIMANDLSIIPTVQLNEMQKKLLKEYYEANELLMELYISSRNVRPNTKKRIEEGLLLPIAEIEKLNREKME